MLSKVLINGVDVSEYLVNYEMESTFGDLLNQIDMKFTRNITDVVTIQTGMTLLVQRGFLLATEDTVLNGYVEKYELEGAGIVNVVGIDKLWDLVRKEVTHTYDSTIDASAGKISEIFKDLVTTYGGLSVSASSIQDSGTTLLLSKFVCNHADIFERCKVLADILNWQFYYNSDDDYVYFEPKGFILNPNTLTVGTEISRIPKWQYDNTEMVNDVTIVGAYQEVETTESGRIGTTTGWTTAQIPLSYVPISVKVYGDASNPPTTLKTGGVPDSTSTFDYYVDGSNKKILPKSGSSFTSGHYYEVRYSLAAPIPINTYNQFSIDTYGLFSKTITYTDIKSVSDAEQRAINYLTQYAVPFVFATIRVKISSTSNIKAGQKIHVIDSISAQPIDGDFVINKYRIRYPADYDELDIGDRFWRLSEFNTRVLEKLKRIEEEEISNTDISNNLVQFDNSIYSPINLENRYQAVYTNTVSGTNVFIFGHPTFGVLGTNKFGAAGVGVDVLYYLAQKSNVYEETFYDTDFRDTGVTIPNSLAEWNTTTKVLTLDTYIMQDHCETTSGWTSRNGAAISTSATQKYEGSYSFIGGAATRMDKPFSPAYTSRDFYVQFYIYPVSPSSTNLSWRIAQGPWTADTDAGFHMGVNGNKIYNYITGVTDSSISLNLNAWNQIRIGINTSNKKGFLWINGVVDATLINFSPRTTFTSLGYFCIMDGTGGSGGYIDMIEAWETDKMGRSLTIDYNNGTITQAKMTVTGSGVQTYKISADGGSNWTTVSNGVLMPILATGTDLRWSITGFGTVTKVRIENYH